MLFSLKFARIRVALLFQTILKTSLSQGPMLLLVSRFQGFNRPSPDGLMPKGSPMMYRFRLTGILFVTDLIALVW
jgi:hypothetical protein